MRNTAVTRRDASRSHARHHVSGDVVSVVFLSEFEKKHLSEYVVSGRFKRYTAYFVDVRIDGIHKSKALG